MYLEMYNKEDYVPLNWDTLASNPDVWETIKEEIEKKFSADCILTVITAAKEAGLKDKDIFAPMKAEDPEEDEEEEKEEYVSVFSDSIGNTIED